MANYRPRDFLTIEQAIIHALKELSDEEIYSATKKKREDLVKYSDPKKSDRNITHRDSVEIDIALMKKDKGHPLLDVHHAIMDKALAGHNQKNTITQSLLHMGARIGRLMEVTEKATDPSSPGGTSISKNEKDEIYAALKEVEQKIASLKKSIE